ncbi:MAG: hypothetical protein R3D88_00225 [Alphaproteobacteria bacterium]
MTRWRQPKFRFGDNDRLAARVAQMIEADLLISFQQPMELPTADPTPRQYSKTY